MSFRQLGQYEDKELDGLYYNRFLYYDSNTGTYISQDPIWLAGNNRNFYAYDSNTTVDPLGLYVSKRDTLQIRVTR
ncbi:RHS repeat-associated core domain-containing protein [Gilliamella sp. ESL0441]|uniref:RHS repeat-associated core domain-containing protein n=1 Tax=Gilliamella sp. ESL0441 TaxID=2704654 RepID=UPI001C6A6B91